MEIVFPDFRPVTLSLIWRYRERRSFRLPFDAVTAVPPEETIFYATNVTSNPVSSRISPIAVRTRPSAAPLLKPRKALGDVGHILVSG
jgi:hypothetical protein